MASTESQSKAHSFIVREHVEKALQKEKGANATLYSFEIKDFTSSGDGYMGFVTSIKVRYSVDGQDAQTSYIAKITPLEDTVSDAMGYLYERESLFYDLLPRMNTIIARGSQPALSFPLCFHYSLEPKREVMYLEDMRKMNFTMYADYMAGSDAAHTVLVMKELARMHAASVLLAHEIGVADLKEKYDCLKSLWKPENYPRFYECFHGYCEGGLTICADICKLIGGYDKVEAYLRKISPVSMSFMGDMHSKSSPAFRVLCHGDLWINNALYR